VRASTGSRGRRDGHAGESIARLAPRAAAARASRSTSRPDESRRPAPSRRAEPSTRRPDESRRPAPSRRAEPSTSRPDESRRPGPSRRAEPSTSRPEASRGTAAWVPRGQSWTALELRSRVTCNALETLENRCVPICARVRQGRLRGGKPSTRVARSHRRFSKRRRFGWRDSTPWEVTRAAGPESRGVVRPRRRARAARRLRPARRAPRPSGFLSAAV